MVKAVVGEETRLKSCEDRLRQSSHPAEVGLVIGKFSFALARGLVQMELWKLLTIFKYYIRLPILRDSPPKSHTLSDVLRHAISIHAKELKGSKALIDGQLGDIIMSLQSRLDIICDEADGDSGSSLGVGMQLSDGKSPEKPVS